MSGGSYNYLCYKESGELLENPWDLGDMARDLNSYFPGSRAAKDTNELYRLIMHYQREVERRREALSKVWHAQEWWESLDYTKDQAQSEIDKYEAGCK